MFRYAPKGKVFWPVTFVSRDPEGGELIEERAYIFYSPLGRKARKARDKRLTAALMSGLSSASAVPTVNDVQKLTDGVEKLTNENDEELIANIHGWKDMIDADGNPLPFSKEVLLAMLDDDPLYNAFAKGLDECSRGAHAKNSSPGPAGTPARAQK
jgi:hypothetical protein